VGGGTTTLGGVGGAIATVAEAGAECGRSGHIDARKSVSSTVFFVLADVCFTRFGGFSAFSAFSDFFVSFSAAIDYDK